MTNAFFPIVRGLDWSCTRGVRFNTIKKESANLKRVRARLAQYPVHEFTLNWEYLRDDLISGDTYPDFASIVGFFMQRAGSFESFLLNLSDVTKKPEDGHADFQQIGVGDGVTTSFQLTRNYGGAIELVQSVSSLVVLDNATERTDVTTSNGGVITFAAAPLAGHIIRATFDLAYRVTFDEDILDVDGLLYQLYELKSLKLVEDKQ